MSYLKGYLWFVFMKEKVYYVSTGSFTHPNYQAEANDKNKYTLSDVKVGPTIYRPSFNSGINFAQLLHNTQIEVRDIAGQKLYTMTPSNNQFQWNVRGSNGMSLGSGVYFIYFFRGGQFRNIKFMVVR